MLSRSSQCRKSAEPAVHVGTRRDREKRDDGIFPAGHTAPKSARIGDIEALNRQWHFFQGRVRALNNATIHSVHTPFSIHRFSPSSSYSRSRSPSHLAHAISSPRCTCRRFFSRSRVHLRFPQFFQSFLSRNVGPPFYHPFATPTLFNPLLIHPLTTSAGPPSSLVLAATDSRYNAQCIFVIKI